MRAGDAEVGAVLFEFADDCVKCLFLTVGKDDPVSSCGIVDDEISVSFHEVATFLVVDGSDGE